MRASQGVSYRLPAQPMMLALEPRMVFDGAAAVTDVPAPEPQHDSTADSAAGVHAPAVHVDAPAAALETLNADPLRFEANNGQFDQQVEFAARGTGYDMKMEQGGINLSLSGAGGADTVRMTWDGGNASANPVGEDRLSAISNYYTGGQSITGVSNFGRVTYGDIYQGVDLTAYGSQHGQLEYDLVVKAGSDPSSIAMKFDGATSLSLDADGNLVIGLNGGTISQHSPVSYQMIDGVRQEVASSFVLLGDNRVGFALGSYDHSQTLCIDPVLSYASYVGSVDDIISGKFSVFDMIPEE